MEINEVAAAGFAKGAQEYQAARPDYPTEVQAWLTQRLVLGAGRRVLEVGAGTGKFCKSLLATGAEVVAVEPVGPMRDILKQDLQQVRALEGTAESLPFPDESFDAVVCAQAFHWFATAEALAEFRRVLKPGGKLGLIWNYRDLSVPWVGRLQQLTEAYEGDVPRFSPQLIDECFPADGFSPVITEVVDHSHCGPAETVIVSRMMSVSFLAALDSERKADVRRQIRDLVEQTPELAGRDSVCFPYQTYMFSAEVLRA